MARKQPFPQEAKTAPDVRRSKTARTSHAAPKTREERARASTLPPKAHDSDERTRERRSGVRAGKRSKRAEMPAATVDEVTADMSKDPRRERDDD